MCVDHHIEPFCGPVCLGKKSEDEDDLWVGHKSAVFLEILRVFYLCSVCAIDLTDSFRVLRLCATPKGDIFIDCDYPSYSAA